MSRRNIATSLLALITRARLKRGRRRAARIGEGPGSDRARPWIRRPGRNRRSRGDGVNLASIYRIPGWKARRKR